MSVILETAGLCKSYRCGNTILRDVSLQVCEGEIVAITGKSGEGKSTIARILCGTTRPDSGSACFGGAPLITAGEYNLSVRPSIQLIPQQPFAALDPRQRVLDAVAEPLLVHRLAASKRQARERAAMLLRSVRLGEELYRRRPWQISGGQAQRVAMARALAVSPRLIIADEATAMLDIPAQAQVVAILRELVQGGAAVLLITHDNELCRAAANRRYHLSDGIATEQ